MGPDSQTKLLFNNFRTQFILDQKYKRANAFKINFVLDVKIFK